MVIGSQYSDGVNDTSSHVRVYKYDSISEIWTQIDNDIYGEAAGDANGLVSISSDGTIVSIGDLYHNGNGLHSGRVRVFDLTDALSVEEFQNTIFNIYPNPEKNNLQFN